MNWELVWQSAPPLILSTIQATIPLSLISFAIGLAIAVAVALMRLSRHGLLRSVARAYVSVIRGTPLLVQLFIIFFGLPSIGIQLSPWPSAIVALALNVGGYAAEVVRAAILSVPRSQWEAAAVIGLSRPLTLSRIVAPQAARVSVPPLANSFISLVKDTSLAALILVPELFRQAQNISASTGEFMTMYIEAAAMYWVVCWGLSVIQARLERRLSPPPQLAPLWGA